MTVFEVLPLMDQLPHADKLQLMQILLSQIAAEEGVKLNAASDSAQTCATSKADKQDLVARPTNAWDALDAMTGCMEAPHDWAMEHDHYLYGTPKRKIRDDS